MVLGRRLIKKIALGLEVKIKIETLFETQNVVGVNCEMNIPFFLEFDITCQEAESFIT